MPLPIIGKTYFTESGYYLGKYIKKDEGFDPRFLGYAEPSDKDYIFERGALSHDEVQKIREGSPPPPLPPPLVPSENDGKFWKIKSTGKYLGKFIGVDRDERYLGFHGPGFSPVKLTYMFKRDENSPIIYVDVDEPIEEITEKHKSVTRPPPPVSITHSRSHVAPYPGDGKEYETSTGESLGKCIGVGTNSESGYIRYIFNKGTIKGDDIITIREKQKGGGKKTVRKSLDDCSVAELKAKAAKRGVSLKGLTKKADIIAKLRR